MTAVLFSRILIGVIALIIAGTGAGHYFLSKYLGSVTVATDHAKIDANIALTNVERLKQLQAQLESKQDVVERTAAIVADSKQYQYQNQIVQDINAYASRSGVTITGFDFATASATKKPAAGQPGTSEPSSVKKMNASITLKTPVPYENFLMFLKAIEQNLTKMQVTGVTMTPDTKNPRAVNNPTIGLEVYVR